ncbi:MAG: MFS transporter [Chloroflexi bacterium]|nr:MFS transporter [Chloroflexota bacterium]MDA1239251.1 MFS transporter [Chloroflexota bacterium]
MPSSEDDEVQDGPRPGMFASLAYPAYRLLWAGQASHAFGIWMEQIARPWLVLEITGDNAAHVGGVVAMRTLPQLIFGLWAGVIADWFDRKTILVLTKGAALLLNLAFAIILLSGNMTLGLIYLMAFLRGSSMAFDQPARQTLIASIVPPQILTNAVALMSSTQNIMRMLGVVAAGATIAALGVNGAFVVIVFMALFAFIPTAMLDVPRNSSHKGQRGLGAMSGGMMEGFRYAVSNPVVLGVLIMSLSFYTFAMSWSQVYAPIFARQVMDIGALGFSMIVATSAIGALAGTLLIASRYPKRLGLILPLSVIGMGIALSSFALASYLPRPMGLIIPFAILPFVGIMQTAYFSLSNATMLTAAPPELRGRVISLLSLDRAMVSAGASLGGLLAAAQGAQMAQLIYGLLVTIAGVVVIFTLKDLRRYRAP